MLLEEVIEPRADLPPLLHRLNERRAEKLDYIGLARNVVVLVLYLVFLLVREYFSINCLFISGVSFGLNLPLLKFWKRAGFVPVYLRQSVCDLTGEHTCIMLKDMNKGIP